MSRGYELLLLIGLVLGREGNRRDHVCIERPRSLNGRGNRMPAAPSTGTPLGSGDPLQGPSDTIAHLLSTVRVGGGPSQS
jgi:hypothetical protein